MKKKVEPISVTVEHAADATAVRCDKFIPAIEINISLKRLKSIMEAVAPVLEKCGLEKAGKHAVDFCKSVPNDLGKPDRLMIHTLANAAQVFPKVNGDLNCLSSMVMDVCRKRNKPKKV